jgi:hypothetical protein
MVKIQLVYQSRRLFKVNLSIQVDYDESGHAVVYFKQVLLKSV